MEIAILNYPVLSVDIIITDKELSEPEEIEKFLTEECDYDINDISYMVSDDKIVIDKK